MNGNKMMVSLVMIIITLGFVACSKDDIDDNTGEPLSLDHLTNIDDAVLPQEYYTDAAFTNENTGYAISNSGVIIKTTDGGHNWTALPSNVSKFLEEIQFTDQQTGYVIGGDALESYILKTSNAGASWTTINLNTPEAGRPSGLWFINNNNGFVTGPGFFIKTSNGGAGWTNALPVVAGNFYDVKFSNATTGIATTDNGAYYKTTDGGQNWQRIETDVNNQLREIYVAGSEFYIRSGNKLIPANPGKPSVTIPAAAHELHFIDASRSIGIGQHYETGFWPYGDIFITNNGWSNSSSKKYMPDVALSFSAIAKMKDRKYIMLGTGHLKVSVVTLEY